MAFSLPFTTTVNSPETAKFSGSPARDKPVHADSSAASRIRKDAARKEQRTSFRDLVRADSEAHQEGPQPLRSDTWEGVSNEEDVAPPVTTRQPESELGVGSFWGMIALLHPASPLEPVPTGHVLSQQELDFNQLPDHLLGSAAATTASAEEMLGSMTADADSAHDGDSPLSQAPIGNDLFTGASLLDSTETQTAASATSPSNALVESGKHVLQSPAQLLAPAEEPVTPDVPLKNLASPLDHSSSPSQPTTVSPSDVTSDSPTEVTSIALESSSQNPANDKVTHQAMTSAATRGNRENLTAAATGEFAESSEEDNQAPPSSFKDASMTAADSAGLTDRSDGTKGSPSAKSDQQSASSSSASAVSFSGRTPGDVETVEPSAASRTGNDNTEAAAPLELAASSLSNLRSSASPVSHPPTSPRLAEAVTQQIADSIVSQAVTMENGDTVTLDAILDPPDLGRLHFRISRSDSGLTASVAAENGDVQQVIAEHTASIEKAVRANLRTDESLQFFASDSPFTDNSSAHGGREQPPRPATIHQRTPQSHSPADQPQAPRASRAEVDVLA